MERNIYKIGKELFITNDEEIKDVDCVIKISSLYKGGGIIFKKIILTTNDLLIKDGIQAINDEFLEWFVKNPSCEFVNLENHVLEVGYNLYKIIIPQEEPKQIKCYCGHTITCDCEPKQEILEEVECNNCGYLMSLTEDESVYACYNSECTSCYEEYEEEPKQEWLKNAKWGVRLTKDKQPDFTYVDQWFEGKLFKRDMLKLVYPDSPSFSYLSWKVFDTKELAEEWIKVPKEDPKQETTLEEAAKSNYDKKTARIPVPTSHWINSEFLQIQNFREGAKWVQEKSYSEEDLISFAHFYFKEEFNSTMQTSKSIDEILQDWLEQFKKK